MTRDYAKKNPQSPKRHRRLWITAAILLALLLAIPALFYVHYMHMPYFHKKNMVSRPLTPPNAKKINPAQADPQQHYDFYSMLPKMYVTVKKQGNETLQIPANQPYYLLQIATSKNKDAAQQLVTKLGVMGLNAFVKQTLIKGQLQYRIIAGPYLNNSSATTDQAYLKSNHINSIKLKTRNYLR